MKTMKKFFAMMLAMIMMMAMAVPVMAETKPTPPPVGYARISVPDTDDHTYSVYQIMTGDYSTKDGKEVLSNAVWGSNAKDKEGAVSEADMTALAEKTDAADIAAYVDFDNPMFTDLSKTKSYDVPTGYYLIKDNGKTDMTGDSYSLYLVQVVGYTTVNAKKDSPSVEKKVYEENKGWQDGADYDIGDAVPFKLTATLGDMTNYKTYFIQFDDTFCEGLDYNADAKVYLGEGENRTEITGAFTISYDESKRMLYVTCNNVKAIDGVTNGSKIVVEYTADLNDKAKIVDDGNFNKVKLEYSNNPNDTQDGTPSKGETPEDVVKVFTYKLIVNKTDGTNPLKGAGFTLYKKSGESYVAVGTEVKGDDLTTFEWKGLDAGEYKIEETTVPVGYNKAADVIFTVEATYDTDSENPKLTGLVVKDADGTVISGDGKTFTTVVSSEKADAATTVVNKSGTTLPETGGMGTTLFYVIGSVLVVAAGVLLVTKRRMSR